MFRRSLTLLALIAFVSVAAATEAAAGCCHCAFPCAPPQIQIWGLSPVYVVNQGPVYTGPGFTTWPTYEGEASIVGYPYVRYGGYPAYRGYPYYRPGLLYHHGLEPRLGPRVLTLISAERGMSRSNRLLYRDPRDR